MCSRIQPIQCIIPPYMKRQLVNDSRSSIVAFESEVRELTIDEKLRAKRDKVSTIIRQAKTGQTRLVLAGVSRAKPKKNREVYTAANKEVQPGRLVRKESGRKTRDVDVNNVYDGAGATWDFYNQLFSRNSIDNRGMKLIQTVHYATAYNNAFWDGTQMVYGDGDGTIFGSFTSDIDIIAHELTHGVIQYECNLDYEDQSGALNESLADVFGIMIKQRSLNHTAADSNWLIGENVIRGNFALRSLKAPGTAYVNHPRIGTDPQPMHMDNYRDDPTDHGGVHLNSGIPNHAFYRAAVEIGGFAWDKTGRVWYAAMCDVKAVKRNATFADFKKVTIAQAKKIFKKDKAVVRAITDAWKAVGV